MDTLPVEITAQILSYLSCYDLFTLQCVNKLWRALFTDYRIVKEISNNDLLEEQSSYESLRKIFFKVQNIKTAIKNQSFEENELLESLDWLENNTKEHIWIPELSKIFSSYYYGYARATLFHLTERRDSVHILDKASSAMSTEQRKDIVNITGRFDRTPLHSAVFCDNLPVVEWLLQQNANVEAKEQAYNQTPLHVAVQKASLPLVQLLVEHNSDISVLDRDRMSIISLSRYNSRPEVTRYCRTISA